MAQCHRLVAADDLFDGDVVIHPTTRAEVRHARLFGLPR
jgi:hypothetical protein